MSLLYVYLFQTLSSYKNYLYSYVSHVNFFNTDINKMVVTTIHKGHI